MMKGNTGFPPLLINLAILAVILLIQWGLVQVDRAAWVIPTPEMTADQLVGALAAHRYSGASEQLSQEVQKLVSSEELQELVQSIEQGPHRGIQDAHGEKPQEEQHTAVAPVKVILGDNSIQTIELPLQKENGLWKVSSIEPLYLLTE